MSLSYSFIVSSTFITLGLPNGETVTVYNTHPKFSGVVEAVKNRNWELAERLSFPVKQIEHAIKSSNKIKIANGIVSYEGEPLHTTLTARMVDMLDQGFDITPLILFLENLMLNPSNTAINELYTFLEKGNLPITEDGHFLAYKRVDSNLKDLHTHKIDNSVGATVYMKRWMVDDNRTNTCSHGLHFCSRSYLSFYGRGSGGRTVVVKVNPADVVSIPSDHDDAKGRCCKYVVVQELIHQNEEPLEGVFRSTPDHDLTTDKPSSRGVEQIDPENEKPIRTFSSVTEASSVTGVDSSGIRKVCTGKRNSAGGFAWRYMEFPSSAHPVITDQDIEQEIADEDGAQNS